MSSSAAPAGLIRPLAREHALLCGLLASLALHALVLLGLSRYAAPAPPSKTLLALTARLAPFAPAAQAPVQAQQAERAQNQVSEPVSAPRSTPAEPPVSPAALAQEAVPAEQARAQKPEPAPASPAAADALAQAKAAQVQARAAPQSRAGIPGAGAGTKPGSEADAGTLQQYRMALIVATRRYKRYPAIAMEKGWQGKVEVHMVINASGMLASASIKASSGHEILDQQALDMLDQGKAEVPIPAGLRGREFDIDVPVIFDLDSSNS